MIMTLVFKKTVHFFADSWQNAPLETVSRFLNFVVHLLGENRLDLHKLNADKQNRNVAGLPGTDVMILKIFSTKNWRF
jgi:hypothetical protein